MSEELKPAEELTIDLAEKSTEKTPAPKEDKIELILEKLDKAEKTINFLSAQKRHYDKISAELEDIKSKITVPVKEEIDPVDMDEIDKLAQKDWKLGVKEVVKNTYKELVEEERKDREKKSIVEQNTKILEDSKKKVLSKHPEINDPASEKTQIFNEILAQNPEYLNNPYGPILVMREMEDRLGANVNRDIDKEVGRRTRINQVSLDTPKGVTKDNKVTLTKEQLDFCKTNNVPVEVYARTLRMAGDKEGVTVQ